MTTALEIYTAARETLEAAIKAHRLARKNLRTADPEAFKLCTKLSTGKFSSPAKRSSAWHARRDAIERIVKKEWSCKTPDDRDACYDECFRIGEICRAKGLYAAGSYAANTIETRAVALGLMNDRVYVRPIS